MEVGDQPYGPAAFAPRTESPLRIK